MNLKDQFLLVRGFVVVEVNVVVVVAVLVVVVDVVVVEVVVVLVGCSHESFDHNFRELAEVSHPNESHPDRV